MTAVPKPRRKPKSKYTQDAADKLFSLLIRSRGACEVCGSTQRLQCAHILSRRYHGIRWADDNAICACASCHWKFTHDPIRWELWIIDYIGEAKYLDLRRRTLEHRGPTNYRAVIAELRSALKTQEAS